MSIRMVDADGRSLSTLTNNETQNILRASRLGSRGSLVVLSMVITFICLILIGIGLFAPSWWTLDVTEYGQVWVTFPHTPHV
jgi:hypothetical protein